jgi:hypothetical protein
MANWFSCYRAILGQSLREAASWKRNLLFVFAGLGVAAVLTMVVVMVGDRRNQNDIFGMVLMVTFFQLLVPITSIYFSASILREEISSRTIVYPAVRSGAALERLAGQVQRERDRVAVRRAELLRARGGRDQRPGAFRT